MDDATQANITVALTELVLDTAPDANLRPMYGGLVIELETNNPRSRIGGFYVHTAHVSLEFAKGAAFDDPDGLLEGSGRARRHLKLRRVEDITIKNSEGFLTQAIARAG